MTLRKGRCYSRIKRAYTRKSKFKTKSFVKGIPSSKIIKFEMGDLHKEFKNCVVLFVKNDIQIRHNALESARVLVNRHLDKILGNNYRLRVMPYPHHVLRENKILSGAGADRLSSGMQLAFGKPIGVAAQIKKGKPLFVIYVDEKDIKVAKDALKFAPPRLPCKCGIEVSTL